MSLTIDVNRCANNPIITPGGYSWRQVASFNPGVITDECGNILLYERAAGSLRPFKTVIGVMKSRDGVNFEHCSDTPILTAEMLGFPNGSVEDARVVRIEGKYYLCYALQPYAFDCWPNGVGVPEYYAEHYREWRKNGLEPMMTQSGIAVSENGIDFTHIGYTTPKEIDDRDNMLFPEKINGKFALLRRPMFKDKRPGIWISYSSDLQVWSEPEPVAGAENLEWEGTKIGASTTPVKTPEGWILFYHGVDDKSVYRLGVMLLDLNNPSKVIGRLSDYIMEPEEYYEKFGLVIPNVIFPTDNIVIEDTIYMYYGCCDTSIGMATLSISQVIDALLK